MSPDKKSDNELVAHFLAGNGSKAFEELVTRYQSSIRQFLRRLTGGDYHAADDISQESFIIMYRKLDTYRGQSSLSTWLHKISYNCFLKYVKNKNKFSYIEEILEYDIEYAQAEIVNDIMLEQLMKHLKVDERTVFTLSFSVGMSHSEIADVIDMPIGTVKSNISRGKAKIARLIKSDF